MGNEQLKHIRKASWLLFIIYMVALTYFLFFSERYGRTDISEGYRYNLVLFQEIGRYFAYPSMLGPEYFIVNIFGNVAAFVPFGTCYPLLHERKTGFFRTAAATFMLSLGVEATQLIFRVGIFDVDDLFMNTLGGIAGYAVYICIRGILNRYAQKAKARKCGKL